MMEESEKNLTHSEQFVSEEIFPSAVSHEFAVRSKSWSIDVDSPDFAMRMDKEDPLQSFRKLFHYPKKKCVRHDDIKDNSKDDEENCIYFCGHSLGLQPKTLENELHDAITNWAKRGVQCHFYGKYPAASSDNMLKENMAYMIGSETNEVALMNSLTVNIHVLLSSFYKPTLQRHKILMLEQGFPSDLYAVQSHVRLRGYDPANTIVFMKPRPGSHLINPKDVLSFIEKEGDKFALIFLEGVHFYSGQLFDMKNITRVGHKKGCVVGFDLAHAVGNVKLHLHEWNVDFAMWCTYKYLNSGPGSMGAIFVHSRHMKGTNQIFPMMAGWWGISDKFSMSRVFEAADGADRFKISNPSPFLVAMMSSSLDIFREAGIDRLQEKQHLLTGYLEYLLRKNFYETPDGEAKVPLIEILTPSNPRRRGCQISLMTLTPIYELESILKEKGIMCDVRKPSVIRVTPVPLYNTFTEVYKFVHALKDIFENFQVSDDEEK